MVVGLLTLTAGCSNKNAQQRTSFALKNPYQMELKISPDHPSQTKPMTFDLHVSDEQGQPVNDAKVSGALTMKVMDMGTTKVDFAAKGNGNYEATVKSTDMSGPWNLAVGWPAAASPRAKEFRCDGV